MRIKTILSLSTFFTAFVLSVLLVGVPKDYSYNRFVKVYDPQETRLAIQVLLDQDNSNGIERNQTISSLNDAADQADGNESYYTNFAEATEQYVSSSESIEDSNLPSDFQAAWHIHMNAWRDQADYINRMNSSNRTIDSGKYRRQTYKINQSWLQVLRVARKYGVDTSVYPS